MRLVRFTPRFWVSLGMFLLVLVFGILGPYIFAGKNSTAIVGGLFDGPSSAAWLGSDNLGHDVFGSLMYGTRTSLVIGLLAGVLATFIGVVIGLVAGYYGGLAEEGLMGFTNVALAIPSIVVLILLSVSLPTRSTVALAIVIAITSWPWTARAVRAQTTSVKARDHLDIARLSGASSAGILMRDVMPFLMSYVCMAFVLHVAGAILAEAALSMLGLGPSDVVSLGNMLHWALASEAPRVGAWWAFIPPTLLLTLIAFTLLMLQSSLDEVFNPRLRGRSGRTRRGVTAVGTAGDLLAAAEAPAAGPGTAGPAPGPSPSPEPAESGAET